MLVGVCEQRRLDASTIPSCMCSSNHGICHKRGGRCLILRSKRAAQAAVSHLLRGYMVGRKEGWFWAWRCQLDLSGILFTSGQSITPVCSLSYSLFLSMKKNRKKSGVYVSHRSWNKTIFTPLYHLLHQRWEVSYESKGMICKRVALSCFS